MRLSSIDLELGRAAKFAKEVDDVLPEVVRNFKYVHMHVLCRRFSVIGPVFAS